MLFVWWRTDSQIPERLRFHWDNNTMRTRSNALTCYTTRSGCVSVATRWAVLNNEHSAHRQWPQRAVAQ